MSIDAPQPTQESTPYEVTLVDEPTSETEPEPEPKPEPEPIEPDPVAPPANTQVPSSPEPPAAPAAAQAGNVLTADPDPDAPVDLTNTFVTGAGEYVGGTTATRGTSKKPVRGPAKSTADATRPAARNARSFVRAVDKSRSAIPLGGTSWTSCGFPAQADEDQVNQGYAVIVVKVSSKGRPISVSVLSETSSGFGASARRCAMRVGYRAAHDRAGLAITSTTPPIRVRFVR